MKKKEYIEILKDIENLIREYRCEVQNSDEEDAEEDDQEEIKKIKHFHNDYDSMMEWAFGFKDKDIVRKDEMIRKWTKYHAELPELFLPENITNDTANLLVLMQIIPHWNENKKNRPCDCGCCE